MPVGSIPSDAEVLGKLKSVFGHREFRPLQRDIVQALLRGQDVFVLMPTGGGKSLCYQLPALLRNGVTIVVSPLIALMKDQVDKLQAMGVAATYINSTLEPSEVGRRQGAVARGKVKLLYVAPERLMTPGTLELLARAPLAMFAIDEVHCISEWGHDFRPEYRELKRLREIFPSATFGAFTATATPRVQADIVDQLGLRGGLTFRGSFNRPNLYYEVRPKQDAYHQLYSHLRERGNVSGIIYCQSRASTEGLAAKLRGDGFNAAAYHAGMENEARRVTQESFARDDLRIIVATIAFGMGIDKPNIRFVVHYDLPKNLEGYYQESGRAGRDGDPSDCILFYSYGDAAKQEYFIRQKESATEREVAFEQLRQIVEWAESPVCRRRGLLAYFDEKLETQPTPCCDICRHPLEKADCTIPAQMLLSCVKRTGERFGLAYVIRVLRGSRDERILQAGHDKLSTFSIGRDRSRAEWRDLARELVRVGYARLAPDEFNAVKVTPLGNEVLFKGRKVALSFKGASAEKTEAAATPTAQQYHHALFEELRPLRKRLADERGISAFVVFHDSTLRHIAAQLPTRKVHLSRIPGVGDRKIADYGDAFLEHIKAYVGRENAKPFPVSPPPPRPKRA